MPSRPVQFNSADSVRRPFSPEEEDWQAAEQLVFQHSRKWPQPRQKRKPRLMKSANSRTTGRK